MPPPELSGGTLNAVLANELGKPIADFTGRTVRTFLSGTDDTGGSFVEAFVLEPEPAPASANVDPSTQKAR